MDVLIVMTEFEVFISIQLHGQTIQTRIIILVSNVRDAVWDTIKEDLHRKVDFLVILLMQSS